LCVGPRFDLGLWLSGAWLVLLVLAAMFVDLLPVGEHRDTTATLATPGNLRPDLFSSHPLGTNNFSLDLLARCVYGARVSLLTALVAVVVGSLVGSVIGVIAGYCRGRVDTAIGVFTDGVLAFPALIMLVALAAVIGIPKTVPEAILKSGVALAALSIPAMVRLARANTLVQAQQEFVLASRAMGARRSRVVLREIYPNVMMPILSYSFVVMAVLIVAEGSLSFLGLGLQAPEPTWGNMIAEGGVDALKRNPHVVLVPGAFIFLTVFSLNRVGEHARAAFAPAEAKL